MCRKEIFRYLNSKSKLVEVLPDDKKETLKCRGLIYQKYVSRLDRFLSFIFGVEIFHLVWEFPNGKRYYEYNVEKEA